MHHFMWKSHLNSDVKTSFLLKAVIRANLEIMLILVSNQICFLINFLWFTTFLYFVTSQHRHTHKLVHSPCVFVRYYRLFFFKKIQFSKPLLLPLLTKLLIHLMSNSLSFFWIIKKLSLTKIYGSCKITFISNKGSPHF